MAVSATTQESGTRQEASEREQRVVGIFAAHADLVFATCYGILRDREEAADASQETFIRALRSIDSIPDDPRPWLRVVARNYCYDLLRSRRRQADLAAGLARAINTGINPELQALDRITLSRALGGLKPRDRAALWDALVEERPMAEVAGRLGLSYMGAAQVVHRARRRALKLIRELSTVLGPLLRFETSSAAGLGRAAAVVAGLLLPALIVIGAGSVPDGAAAPGAGPGGRPAPVLSSAAGTPTSTAAPVPPDAGLDRAREQAVRGAIDGLPSTPDVPGLPGLPDVPGVPDLAGTAGGLADLVGGTVGAVVSTLPQASQLPAVPDPPKLPVPVPSLPLLPHLP